MSRPLWLPLLASLLSLAACGPDKRVPRVESPTEETASAPPDAPAPPPTEVPPASPPTPSPAPSPVVSEEDPVKRAALGLWESAVVSNTGFSSVLEFRAGGEVVAGTVMVIDGGRWRWQDGKLAITDERDEYRKPLGAVTYSVEFTSDGAILRSKAGDRRMKRVARGADDQPEIAGVWSWERDSAHKAFTRYAADGRVATRVPMFYRKGTWTTEDTAVVTTVSLTGKAAAPLSWTLAGDRLSREPDPKDPLVDYRRVEGGAWYPLEVGERAPEAPAPAMADPAMDDGAMGDGMAEPPMEDPNPRNGDDPSME